MIFVMSKRVYLNKFCPLTSKDVLLNANYYIADKVSPKRMLDEAADQYEYVDGEWKIKDKPKNTIRRATPYNVRYGRGALNPGQYVTTLLDYEDEEEIFQRMKETLSSFRNMREIMEDIYKPPRRGNGILIIIYMMDDNIVNFGHIVCEHLVTYFGEDITFLDPKYRPNVKGNVTYHCHDMEFVRKVSHDLMDGITVWDFMSAVGQSPDIESSLNNITSYLVGFNETKSLIHLYELLWPEDPLPQGKYTLEQIREIIIAKTIDSKSSAIPQQSRLNVVEIYDPEYY